MSSIINFLNGKNVKMKLKKSILQIIEKNGLIKSEVYKSFYESYKKIDFLYDTYLNYVQSSTITSNSKNEYSFKSEGKKLKDISDEFYQGFGFDL